MLFCYDPENSYFLFLVSTISNKSNLQLPQRDYMTANHFFRCIRIASFLVWWSSTMQKCEPTAELSMIGASIGKRATFIEILMSPSPRFPTPWYLSAFFLHFLDCVCYLLSFQFLLFSFGQTIYSFFFSGSVLIRMMVATEM